MHVRVKICGVVQPDDVLRTIDAGADIVGLNFVPKSPRCLDLAAAEAISSCADGQIERVAVFQDAEAYDIEHILKRIEVDRVQLHGDEDLGAVEQVELPVIKAIRGADQEKAEGYPGCIVLLDNPKGGGGHGLDWKWSESAALIEAGMDIILAGGFSPDNVAGALEELEGLLPWGVDVATGVEGESHCKDAKKIEAFVKAVRQVEEAA